MAAAALNFELGERARLERNDAQVQAMSTAFLSGRGWEFSAGWLNRLRQLTKADVVAAAQRLFAGPQVRVQRISGEPSRATLSLTKGEPTASGAGHSPLFESLAALPLEEAPLQVLVEGVHYQRAEGLSGVHYAVPSPYQNGLSRLTLNLERGGGEVVFSEVPGAQGLDGLQEQAGEGLGVLVGPGPRPHQERAAKGPKRG